MRSQRRKSNERRNEIIHVVLDMLVQCPVEKITTREIAKEIGVSQPAIYRHFLNRDQMFEAVIVFVMEELEKGMTRLFLSKTKGLEASLKGVLGVLSNFPGFPKLFFYYLTQNRASRARTKLSQIKSMIQNLVSRLVQDEPNLNGQIDGQRAGAFLVALIQGTQLNLMEQDGMHVQKEHFQETLYSLLDFWLAGLRSGQPEIQSIENKTKPNTDPTDFLDLDVRQDIKRGVDPFDRISKSLNRILPGGLLVVLVPFEPKPLIAFQQAQNHGVACIQWEKDWICIIDPSNRLNNFHDLEAPLPLEETLKVATKMIGGQSAWLWLPKEPHLLFPHLERLSVQYQFFSAFGAVFLKLKKGEAS